MYKNLSIAVLLVAFGLVAARSTGAPTSTSTSPTIVKTVVLANQTASIPTTTLFTPAATGLFRISIYMTQAVAISGNAWTYYLGWTDDAGQETSNPDYGQIQLYSVQAPPNAYGSNAYVYGAPGDVAIIEAIAGKPVTFSVPEYNTAIGGGTYSVYFIVEKLI